MQSGALNLSTSVIYVFSVIGLSLILSLYMIYYHLTTGMRQIDYISIFQGDRLGIEDASIYYRHDLVYFDLSNKFL